MENDVTKIFLEKNRSTLSSNLEQILQVDISTKSKLLPNESLVDNFSLFEQYNKERDNCDKYRVILNINPLCTNVLFNIKSEIVIDEGSSICQCLNFAQNGWNKSTYAVNAINTTTPIKLEDAIRNTEYSHEKNGNFIYHCGVDIFNNHLIRKKIFMHINKADYNPKVANEKLKVYNTIADYLRDNNGHIIEEDLKIKYNQSGNIERHIYDTDSLMSLKSAFYDKCEEKDGWWGFINPGMINIPTSSSNTISVNEMLSNNNPCEFINFYPDSSLFSFIPKFNNKRKRIEKNWDYCLTYPYAKEHELLKEICGVENDSIKVNFKVVTNTQGVRLLQCTSYFKHNLQPRNMVNLYYYNTGGWIHPENVVSDSLIRPHYYDDDLQPEEEESTHKGATTEEECDKKFYKLNGEFSVYSIGDLNGDNKDRIFSIKYDEIKSMYDQISSFGLSYKKLSNGCECSYYIRKFKKIKNISGEDLRSEINKIAFGKNIYGDDLAQIVFIDDVDLSDLRDENGRPVSNIFLTTIKTNRGNELWYKDNNTSSDKIEYSHCFGKLTSGIDFSGVDVNEEPFDYNVRYLHNLNVENCFSNGNVINQEMLNTFSAWGETVLNGMPKFIESGITIDCDEFYGDVVEFDNYEYKTTTIGFVCHRFNTMQRELFDTRFKDLTFDEITRDDYDAANNINRGNGFRVNTYYLNDMYSSMRDIDVYYSGNTLMYCNIAPEGYFYNPHSGIKLREESNIFHSPAMYINYTKYSVEGRHVSLIYKVTSEGDVLIGKKYVNFDYLNNDGLSSGGGRDRTSQDDPAMQELIYSVDSVDGIIVKILVPVDFGFIKGDYVCFYDKVSQETYWGCITSFKDMVLTLMFDIDELGGAEILSHPSYFSPNGLNRRFFAFWSENNVPTHAKLCLEANEFSWRNLLNPSELTTRHELYDTPFSNGRLYIEKNLNFYLKRQDPRGEYGLSVPYFKSIEDTVPNPMVKLHIDGKPGVDLSKYKSVIDRVLDNCY